jgi:hypothetical protein
MASQKCICDPGLSDADCILTSKWPPVPTTDEGIPQAQLPTEEEEEQNLQELFLRLGVLEELLGQKQQRIKEHSLKRRMSEQQKVRSEEEENLMTKFLLLFSLV